jgi:uncharacterized peroxidase-related enzyme
LQKGLAYQPETTDALWNLSLCTVMEGSIREELKRVFFAVASHEIECEYCTAAHMLALVGKEWSQEECVAIIQGNHSPRLSDKENAAVDFARVLGRRPSAVTDEMVAKLKTHGWSDAEIVEIITSVALMRYTSTVACALDVPLEASMEMVSDSCKILTLNRKKD